MANKSRQEMLEAKVVTIKNNISNMKKQLEMLQQEIKVRTEKRDKKTIHRDTILLGSALISIIPNLTKQQIQFFIDEVSASVTRKDVYAKMKKAILRRWFDNANELPAEFGWPEIKFGSPRPSLRRRLFLPGELPERARFTPPEDIPQDVNPVEQILASYQKKVEQGGQRGRKKKES